MLKRTLLATLGATVIGLGATAATAQPWTIDFTNPPLSNGSHPGSFGSVAGEANVSYSPGINVFDSASPGGGSNSAIHPTDSNAQMVTLSSVDPSLVVQLASFSAGQFWSQAATDVSLQVLDGSDNVLWGPENVALANIVSLYEPNVSASTLKLVFSASGNPQYFGIDKITFNVIPEPASLSLLGLAGLALIRRRR